MAETTWSGHANGHIPAAVGSKHSLLAAGWQAGWMAWVVAQKNIFSNVAVFCKEQSDVAGFLSMSLQEVMKHIRESISFKVAYAKSM